MKTGVLKHLTKMTYSPSQTFQYKQQVTRKWVGFQEIPTPVSPQLKKQCVKDMAKHILKKQQKHKKQRKLVLHEHSIDEELVPKMPVTKKTSHISPVRDTPVQSSFEKSGNPGGNVETSTMDATINHGEQSTKSTHKQTTTIPPKVSTTESFMRRY